MSGKRIRLGSISLLFSVIVLCVAVLAVLGVSTAQADLAVTEQYAHHTTRVYALESAAQQWLAAVDGAAVDGTVSQNDLPAGTTLEGDVVSVLLEQDGLTADLSVQLTPEGETPYQILRWRVSAQWHQDESLNLWQNDGEETLR